MLDTPSNSQACPQSREQQPGLSFPIAHIDALIGLSSSTILGYEVVACESKGTVEQSLLMHLTHHLIAGDVLLADVPLAIWWIIDGVTSGRARP